MISARRNNLMLRRPLRPQPELMAAMYMIQYVPWNGPWNMHSLDEPDMSTAPAVPERSSGTLHVPLHIGNGGRRWCISAVLSAFTTPRNPSGMVWAAQLPPVARLLGWRAGHYLVGLRAVQFRNRVSRPVVEYEHSMSIAYGWCL
jgi:hypothetical protein